MRHITLQVGWFSGSSGRASGVRTAWSCAKALGRLSLLCGFVTASLATDRYVSGTAGNNTYDGLTQTWDGVHGPKQTIQAAINTASSGDTITVAQGTYAAAITFGGRNLTLRSTAPTDWAVVSATVISAPSGTTAVTFNTGETAAAVLTGFTVTSSSGRGISCTSASPTVRSCRITGNSSSSGGGLYLSGSSATIRNCLIYSNFTGMSGAGGVYTQNGSPTLENCTIASNSCGAGGALAGGVGVSTGSATVRNCILWANTRNGTSEQGYISTGASATVSYSCIQSGQSGFTGTVNWGSGILSSDPLFANAAGGDYHLKSVFGRWNGTAWVTDAQSSPGIDAGCPTDDYSNEPPGNGLRINLGFDGNTPFASLSAAANPEFVLTPSAVTVPEGGTESFTVTLSQAPTGTVAVTVSVASGDADISVTAGASFSLDATDWSTGHSVTLSAAEDNADAQDGAAAIAVQATGITSAQLTATEADDDVTLTVTGGTPTGTSVHESGSVVTVTGTPAAHHHFTQWTGNTGALANPLAQTTQATLTADTTLAAGQTIDRHTLTLVSAHGSPQGAGEYDYGTTVDWSVASPVGGGAGERFVSAQTAGQVLMDQNHAVELVWTTQYLLSVAAGEHGSVQPAAQWYNAGATATASAAAALGWHFVGWTGDVPPASQADNPVTLTMDQARSVAAAIARNTTTYWAALKSGTGWNTNWPARSDSAWCETASTIGGGWQADLSVQVAAGQAGFAVDTVAVADRSGTPIAADGFESDTTGQPPGGWTFNPAWGDLGTLVVTEATAAAGAKSLVLAGSTTDQGIFLPATAAAGDVRLSLALYLPSTLPSSATLLSLWYRGVCVSLRTAAAGAPELGLGLDAAAPAVCLNQPLTTGAWNTLTLFVQTVADTDADGMADAWESAVFGDLSRDGSGDYDADGNTDLLEWQCGTNPAVANPAAVLVPPAQTEVTETAGTVTCQLQLSQSASVPVIVTLSFAGTATLGTDYTTTCGTEIVFSPGQTVVSIPLTILTDAVWDPAETIVLGIAAVSGACPGSPTQVTITIREVDDDGDGMDDQWEITFLGSTAATATADPDEDGLTNLTEFQHQSDPTDVDTNGDGLRDGDAIAWGLEPAQPAALVAITAPASGKVLP